MKVKRKGWWLDRLWVELVVAAFGALVLDLHSRLVDLERRKDINAVPSISRDDGLAPGQVVGGRRKVFREGPKDPVEEVEK